MLCIVLSLQPSTQAAMAAGQKEAASEALSRWLESLSGRPDAAVDLGSGGAAPALETEAALQVRDQHIAHK